MFAACALQRCGAPLVGSPLFESRRFLCGPLVCLLAAPADDCCCRCCRVPIWLSDGRRWAGRMEGVRVRGGDRPTLPAEPIQPSDAISRVDPAPLRLRNSKASNAETITAGAVAKHSPRRTNGTIPPGNDDAIEQDSSPRRRLKSAAEAQFRPLQLSNRIRSHLTSVRRSSVLARWSRDQRYSPRPS